MNKNESAKFSPERVLTKKKNLMRRIQNSPCRSNRLSLYRFPPNELHADYCGKYPSLHRRLYEMSLNVKEKEQGLMLPVSERGRIADWIEKGVGRATIDCFIRRVSHQRADLRNTPFF